MGKLILCTGKQAANPFCFRLTDTKIYSLEELCYYLYYNIHAMNEDMLDEKLITWFREECNVPNLADKLQVLIEKKNSIKDIIVTILCSADYYTESEIKSLIAIMDEMENLKPIERQKIKADNYLNYKMYAKAAKEYDSILTGKEAASLSTEEYGRILHNLAITHLYMTSYREAAKKYKEAYNLNHNEETLKQYFYILILLKEEDKLSDEMAKYEMNEESIEKLKKDVEQEMIKAESHSGYQNIHKLPQMKEEGRVSEYYQTIDNLLNRIKAEYRKEIMD